MPRLPPQPWTQQPEAARLLTALGAHHDETRMVGGAVRDALLGTQAHDIDLATIHPPHETQHRIEQAGLRAVPTGLAHGTITAIADGRPYEITTLRRDIATDGRHATVAYTDSWAEDAARRDFTINALTANALTLQVHDHTGGLADLAARRVRFIGDPARRIAEDHLRILRFFRFHARFAAGAPDPQALAACAAAANSLMSLSRERIRDELLKLLTVPDPVPTVATMLAHGILSPILPDATDLATLTTLVAHERALAEPAHPLRRLAALLPPDPTRLDTVAQRLRLSNADRRRLVLTALRSKPLEPTPALAYRHGVDTARDLLLLTGAPAEALTPLTGWVKPKLPVTGGDLIAAGMKPGPEVAARLRELEEAWVAAGFAT